MMTLSDVMVDEFEAAKTSMFRLTDIANYFDCKFESILRSFITKI
jgi:hypothetical protein